MMGMRSLVKRKNVGRLFLHGVGRAGPGVRFLLQSWTLAMEGPPSNKLVLEAKPKVTIQVSEPHL